MIPKWAIKNIDYYLGIADKISKSRIRCYSRQIGSVLVKDDAIIATGFNGPPRGIPKCDEWEGNWEKDIIQYNMSKNPPNDKFKYRNHKKCPRHLLDLKSGEGLEYCPAVHSERNCLLIAAKRGTSTDGSILFMNTGLPCKDCMIELIQAGVVGIVLNNNIIYDSLSIKIAEKVNMPIIVKKQIHGKNLTKWYIREEDKIVEKDEDYIRNNNSFYEFYDVFETVNIPSVWTTNQTSDTKEITVTYTEEKK